jgi:hypothetical protein
LQVDPGLVAELLAGSSALRATREPPRTPAPARASGPDDLAAASEPAIQSADGAVRVQVRAGRTLNAVAQEVERQYMLALFAATRGSFAAMAELLLGDSERTRAVRLRFNQLGLKVRDLRRS